MVSPELGIDLGVRNSLLGLNSISQIENLGQYGIIFENAIVERLNTMRMLKQVQLTMPTSMTLPLYVMLP